MTESTNAVCWLKSRVTPRIEASCCVSGVRGTGVIEPKIGPIEFGIDRFGGDLRHFDIPADPTGKTCQAACEAEESCRAWTLCASRLYRALGGLLSEEPHHEAGAQSLLPRRRGAVDCRTYAVPTGYS